MRLLRWTPVVLAAVAFAIAYLCVSLSTQITHMRAANSVLWQVRLFLLMLVLVLVLVFMLHPQPHSSSHLVNLPSGTGV